MELWQSLLVAFGGNAALLLVLGFLGRSLVSTVLEKDITKFKADIERVAVEHQIRFSKLHEKRAEVLAELYKLLVAAHWQVSEFTSLAQWGNPDRKAQYAGAINAVATYFRFFDQHRIWLPPEPDAGARRGSSLTLDSLKHQLGWSRFTRTFCAA